MSVIIVVRRVFAVISLLIFIVLVIHLAPQVNNNDDNIKQFIEPHPSIVSGQAEASAYPQDEAVARRQMRHWIVTIATSAPTFALRQLCKLENWQTVVVTTEDFSHLNTGSCVFLSLKRPLPYLVSKLLMKKQLSHMAHKNTGYLYAIHHGAQVILDTDEFHRLKGNQLSLLDGEFSDQHNVFSQAITWSTLHDAEVVNVHAHFGRPDLVMRGWPINELLPFPSEQPMAGFQTKDHQISTKITFSQGFHPPLDRLSIVHGLIDLGADNSAIRIANSEFCTTAPVLQLDRDLFAPFDSRNTLFYNDALWALLLPLASNLGNGNDIVRSYWSQRLLWDVGGRVMFHSPTARDVLFNRPEESNAYQRSKRLVKILSAWHSDSPSLETRLMDLFEEMIQKKIMKKAELRLLQSWIEDLKAIGYVFPKIASNSSSSSTTEPISNETKQKLQVCSFYQIFTARLEPHFQNILVVVHFSSSSDYLNIAAYMDLYSPAFPNILLYGPEGPEASQIYHNVLHYNSSKETSAQLVLLDVYKRLQQSNAPVYSGILYTNHDIFLNYWALMGAVKNHAQKPWYHLDQTDFWSKEESIADGSLKDSPASWRDVWPAITDAVPKLPEWAVANMQSFLQTNLRSGRPLIKVPFIKAQSDLFYIPLKTTHTKNYFELLDLMSNIGAEIALPTSLFMAFDAKTNGLHKLQYANVAGLQQMDNTHHAFHPQDLSESSTRQLVSDTLLRFAAAFMNIYVPSSHV